MVNQLEVGQIDADLGGGVYKQRVARPGAGKSGGYRVIMFFRSGDKTFFVYGFAKSDMDTITPVQLRKLKRTAKDLFSVTPKQVEVLLASGTFKELEEEPDYGKKIP